MNNSRVIQEMIQEMDDQLELNNEMNQRFVTDRQTQTNHVDLNGKDSISFHPDNCQSNLKKCSKLIGTSRIPVNDGPYGHLMKEKQLKHRKVNSINFHTFMKQMHFERMMISNFPQKNQRINQNTHN